MLSLVIVESYNTVYGLNIMLIFHNIYCAKKKNVFMLMWFWCGVIFETDLVWPV